MTQQRWEKGFAACACWVPVLICLALIDVYHISDLVIAINGEIQGATFQSILDAQEKGVEVTRMPILYEEMTGRVPVHHLESDWIIRSFVDGLHVSGFYELTKRLLDILGGNCRLADLCHHQSISFDRGFDG